MIDEKTMIKVIDARLHYLFSSPEKYNMEEVNALINLLKEYDPDVLQKEPEIHITTANCQDPETIIALISVITCLSVLTLIALFELN